MRLAELAERAGIGARLLGATPQAPVRSRHALIVPAYREAPETLEPLLRSLTEDVLVVLLVNEPRGAAAASHAMGARLLDACRSVDSPLGVRASLGKLLAAHYELPPFAGAGGARRLGCQIALELMDSGEVDEPWLHHTDADCVLPEGYFAQTARAARADSVAALHGFGHDGRGASLVQLQAACAFESCLHTAQLWLERVSDPYAMTPGGFGLSIHRRGYEASGGWLPLAHAEDIDMIARLHRIGRVHRLPKLVVGVGVRPESRGWTTAGHLDGHGTELARIAAGMGRGGQVLVSVPATWQTLGLVLALVRGWASGQIDPQEPLVPALEGVRQRSEVLRGGKTELAADLVLEHLPDGRLFGRLGSQARYFDQYLHPQRHAELLGQLDCALGVRPLEQVLEGSPWGVRHAGDWQQTAASLSRCVIEQCTGDVGLPTLR